MNAFDAHPLLVLAMALLGLPLILDPRPRGARGRRLAQSRRDAPGLLLAGALLGLAAWGLGPWLGLEAPAGWAAWPWLSAWLALLSLPLVLLEPYMTRHRSWSEFALWPACLFWPLLDPGLGWGHGLWRAPLAGLLGAALLTLLRGVLERFRQNRSPRGLEGIPVRLLSLVLMLLLWAGAQAALLGRLP